MLYSISLRLSTEIIFPLSYFLLYPDSFCTLQGAPLIDSALKAEKERAAKCPVFARPVLKLVVAIRFLCVKRTDSHTSDVGHWLGMTGSGILQRALGSSPRFRTLLLMHFGGTLLSLSGDSYSETFPMCKSAVSLQIA